MTREGPKSVCPECRREIHTHRISVCIDGQQAWGLARFGWHTKEPFVWSGKCDGTGMAIETKEERAR